MTDREDAALAVALDFAARLEEAGLVRGFIAAGHDYLAEKNAVNEWRVTDVLHRIRKLSEPALEQIMALREGKPV
jgi:hypothetical protein